MQRFDFHLVFDSACAHHGDDVQTFRKYFVTEPAGGLRVGGTNYESALPATPREKFGDSGVHVVITAKRSPQGIVECLHGQGAKAFVIAYGLSKLAQNSGQEA